MGAIIFNGHPEKLVKELRKAADEIVAGNTAYIAISSDEIDGVEEIQFTPDSSEFGLEDPLYAELDN